MGRLMQATAAIKKALGGLSLDAHSLDAHPLDALPRIDLRDLVRAKAKRTVSVPVPDGAQFVERTFANEAGSRPYKVYVPSGVAAGRPAPLVVMLHGCTQSPDDFAAGTRMNAVAEELGWLVVYPQQTGAGNAQKCWNWFEERDQRRGMGEPSLIAGITREVMAAFPVDPARVFVAGLSAGGAAAAIMGRAYPELYAAVGVHSGLAIGAARDMPSAFAAMRQGAPGAAPGGKAVPTIVFHGDRDATVSPRNGDAVAAQAAGGAVLRTRVEHGQGYTRTLQADGAGRPVVEHWLLQGGPHAWSGGSPAGSYTHPNGPDATREMVRFFREVTSGEQG